jgi:lipoate-protein ligase B
MALNVDSSLARFSLFVPCGITDGGVTSMKQVLGPETPSIFDVANTFASRFCDVFSLEGRSVTLEESRINREAGNAEAI